ncbi:S8 family serine peptidase [Actinoplanes sp. DH11]|uniref:S8 family peptidase n=1 Tax=Actinoplanes sp. DH11 TaxID=2857011 RepID=UPI001E41AB16|nr:S8 family serine peptidase [Actinoplanes sp. DH11]
MHRRVPALLTSSILAAGLLAAPAAAAAKPVDATEPAATAQFQKPVTLITGDRVHRHGKDVSVQRGAGRENVTFATHRAGDHHYVIPSDALGLIRQGRLDKRLFDITQLPATAELPLIITHADAGANRARSALSAGEARVTRDLSAIDALAVRADLEGRAGIWSSLTGGTDTARTLQAGVQKIWLDGKRQLSLDRSVPQIGAPAAYRAGYDGTGVTVAVLDSGIDQNHPDFAGKIVEAQNFTTAESVDDIFGHGTHVASIIAGSGAASGGKYAGVAPGAKLLVGKVCEAGWCEESSILAGMIWAAERSPVINLSLGGRDTPEVDPLEQAVQELTAQHDTLFVIAAGNEGTPGSIGSPSSADAALSVGAVDREDRLADFSSRGPRTGDGALKPDITAPGVGIVAAKAANGVIGDPAPDGYVALDGTSMATPHVAGAAALLTQQHPGWSSRLRKNTLIASAQPADGTSAFDQGAGRVDVARQITQTVTVDEGSVSFGIQAWPHDDDQPITRTVTYRNAGTTPVNLALSVSGAPFTVAASTLTVPAGGTASTTVTAGVGADLAEAPLGGYLTATAPSGVRVTTALGVVNEVESYDLTVRVLGRDGQPSADNLTVLLGLDEFASIDVPASGEVRVPAGRYGLFSWIFQGEESSTMLTESELVVDGNRSLTLDARTAKPLRVTPPQRDAGTVLAAVNGDWETEEGGYYSAGLGAAEFDELYAGPVSKVSKPFFRASVFGSFARPGAAEDFRNSPYTTDLAYFREGLMFEGLRKAPKLSELAAFTPSYGVEATGVEGAKANVARYSEEAGLTFVYTPFSLPFRRTEYVNPEVPWFSTFSQTRPGADGFTEFLDDTYSETRKLRAGRTYPQAWNRAVIGPNVTKPLYDPQWVTRYGDFLVLNMPLHGDGAGHPGFSYLAEESVKLYRGNALVGEGWEVEVPPETATYRLEATATRGAPHVFSTDVRGTWTFRSGHVEGEEFQRLPVRTIRFAPAVDDRNSAPAGRRFDIPVVVEHQPGVRVGAVRSVTVDVSYDDGRTWRKADVRGSGDKRVATVRHPDGAGFVSLRASAADTHGNTVSQSLVRAYALR